MNALKKLLLTGSLTVLAGTAQAASISLVPSMSVVDEGSSFTVDLVLSATGQPQQDAVQGIVILDYDPNLVRYIDFAFNAPAVALSPTTTGTNGLLNTVQVSLDQAPVESTVGTFSFSLLDAGGDPLAMDGDMISFGLIDGDDFFGSFVYTVPTDTPVPGMEFNGASVSVVPIPSAAWLMMSALGLVITTMRKKI